MRLGADGTLRLSPTDLANHLACAHLTQLDVAVLRDGLIRPLRENPHADLIRRKGDEHEAAFLAQLLAEGREVVEIGFEEDGDLEEAARRTVEALRAGAEIVYQGVLASGGWRGIADFLVRVDEPSALGGFSYEAWDTKLARYAKPNAACAVPAGRACPAATPPGGDRDERDGVTFQLLHGGRRRALFLRRGRSPRRSGGRSSRARRRGGATGESTSSTWIRPTPTTGGC